MIVCSCAVISDRDLELAVLEVMSAPDAPLPTPGVIYRHLQKKMQCCGCAPLAADTIYAKMEDLERRGLICPCACASARSRLTPAPGRLSLVPVSIETPSEQSTSEPQLVSVAGQRRKA